MNPNGSNSRERGFQDSPRMVISRVPLRISFVGGGSDLPPGSGATISAAINKYVYVMAKWRHDDRVILNWREKENVASASDLQHELAREALKLLGVHTGVEISTFADVPGVGSGLGSSSATTVAIVQSVAALTGLWLEPQRLARAAVNIELERLQRRGGSQDQQISAIGGVHVLDHEGGRCKSERYLGLSPTCLKLLARHFALFSPPGGSLGRDADQVLATKQDDDTGFRTDCMALVDKFKAALEADDFYACGRLVSAHDNLKRCTFGQYFPEFGHSLDKLSLNWKLCGAGGSGHVLVAVTPETRQAIVASVEKVCGQELPWEVSESGATVIHAS